MPTTLVRLIASIGFLVSLAACSFGHTPLPNGSRTHGLIYGNIKVPGGLQAVQATKVLSIAKENAWVYPNGDFLFEDVEPGEYLVFRFKSGGRWYSLVSGDKEQDKKWLIKVAPGSMTYLGSFQVTAEEDNLLLSDTYQLERVSAPTESQILKVFEKDMQQTSWNQKIKARVKKN